MLAGISKAFEGQPSVAASFHQRAAQIKSEQSLNYLELNYYTWVIWNDSFVVSSVRGRGMWEKLITLLALVLSRLGN